VYMENLHIREWAAHIVALGMLHSVAVLQCVAACCGVLRCVAVHRSVLQCACDAVCCSVLQCVLRASVQQKQSSSANRTH